MIATATLEEIKKFTVRKGDVIATKDSETPDDIANPAYVREEIENLVCGYHLSHIRTNHKILSGEYLFRLFQSTRINSFFETSANGITRYGLSIDSFKNIFIPIPPISVQESIVLFINQEHQRIDFIISKIDKEISLLQEYRTALISEVVTGKIDVRKEVI